MIALFPFLIDQTNKLIGSPIIKTIDS